MEKLKPKNWNENGKYKNKHWFKIEINFFSLKILLNFFQSAVF